MKINTCTKDQDEDEDGGRLRHLVRCCSGHSKICFIVYWAWLQQPGFERALARSARAARDVYGRWYEREVCRHVLCMHPTYSSLLLSSLMRSTSGAISHPGSCLTVPLCAPVDSPQVQPDLRRVRLARGGEPLPRGHAPALQRRAAPRRSS